MTATGQTATSGGGRTAMQVPFDSLMATHRGARRKLQLYFWALLLVGIGLVLLGLFAVLPLLPALVVGIVTAAVAVFPYREMVERDERIEGLHVLHDEWSELQTTSDDAERESDRFIELLWKLYGKR